jgi:4-amino-4-deoxychorismate lyase
MKDLLFIETMRVIDGEIVNLNGHLNRMRNTINEVYGHDPELDELDSVVIPNDAEKCRILYGENIQSIEFSDYKPRQIESLKLVEVNEKLDYHLKYADRSVLTSLSENRGDCDEILIIQNGHVTDTSFSNVVFTDGKRFVTPDTYLLPGTMRANLLRSATIMESSIRVEDIKRYTHIALINAMLPLNRIPFIPIEKIQ